MIIPYLLLVFAFILDTSLLNYIDYTINSIQVFPMFTISSIVMGYFYSKNNVKFLIFTCVAGFMVDIIWTNTIFIYAIIYTLLGLIIIVLNKLFAINIINYLVEVIIIISLENAIVYYVLVIIKNIDLDSYVLLVKILKSIPITIMYSTIMYFIMHCVNKKLKLRKRY